MDKLLCNFGVPMRKCDLRVFLLHHLGHSSKLKILITLIKGPHLNAYISKQLTGNFLLEIFFLFLLHIFYFDLSISSCSNRTISEHNVNHNFNFILIPELVNLFVVVVESFSQTQLFVTPWTAAHQASLSFTSPRVYPNSCPLILWCHQPCRPLLHLPSIFPSIDSFWWMVPVFMVSKGEEFTETLSQSLRASCNSFIKEKEDRAVFQ